MLNNDTNHSIGNQLRSQKKKEGSGPREKVEAQAFAIKKHFKFFQIQYSLSLYTLPP